ncbi:MAG: GAF domain-containing protein [Verrucomicrobiota bacterium]
MSRLLIPKELRVLGQPQKLLNLIIQTAVRVTKANSGSIMLLNPNTGMLDIEASVGLSANARQVKLRHGEGVTGWVADTGKPLLVNDVVNNRHYIRMNPKVSSELAVPLELEGNVIGVVNIDSYSKDAFNIHDQNLLIQLAGEASEWLRHSWEINQLRVRSQQLETLVDMGQTIISETELDVVLDRITEDATKLMKAKLSSLMLVNEEDDELILKAWAGAPEAYIDKPNLTISDSLIGVVFRRRKPLVVLNVQENQSFQHTELARQEGLFSLLAVPLVFQGTTMGVLCVYTGKLHRFSNEEIRLLKAMADMSAIAIAKAKLLEKIVKEEEELKASERLSALGWLAAEIAHEIRNPLTVVQMLFHTMVHGGGVNEDYLKDASLIDTKMKHMNRILDQVLAFARSSEPAYEPIDPMEMINDLVTLVRHKLSGQQISIKKKISSLENEFYADRPQLEQAILNLVLNAAHAMPDGGTLTLSVKEKHVDDQNWVIISIKDTGSGIPKEIQEGLFQPFLSHRKGGTGLGLALVKKTVENHRGKVKLKSRKGRGTIFELMLPAGEHRGS